MSNDKPNVEVSELPRAKGVQTPVVGGPGNVGWFLPLLLAFLVVVFL